ncbi:MAG: DUF309 domain-containing protein [Fidelibacterota bacterium]
MPPRKRSVREISHLQEPRLSREQYAHFREGIDLLNRGKYWEAHESWEDVWKTMTDRPEDDGEIILRGLIQFTAGLHGLSVGKRQGGTSNLQKAREKLELFPGRFLGVDLNDIVSFIRKSLHTPGELPGYQIH